MEESNPVPQATYHDSNAEVIEELSQEFSPLTTHRAHTQEPEAELAVDLQISGNTFTQSSFAPTIESRNTLAQKDSQKKKRQDTTPRQTSQPQRKPTLTQSAKKTAS